MNYPQNVDAKFRNQAANDLLTQAYYDYDSFTELSSLTFAQARSAIKANFNDEVTRLILEGPDGPITLLIGNSTTPDQSVQLKAVQMRDSTGQWVDVSTTAQWLTDPTPSNVVAILNGVVTANMAGSVDVYARLSDTGFETRKLSITVM